MRAGAAGLEMAELPRLGRDAHVENQKSFGKRLIIGTAPAWRNAFEAGDHFPIGDLNLNRPGIFRPANKGTKFGRARIGDIEHAPTAVPEVGNVKIPAAVHLLHSQLERGPAI